MTVETASSLPTRRDVLRSIGAGGALGVVGVTPALAASEPPGSDDRTTTTESDTSGGGTDCALPVFTDEYVGFSVGRPDGWLIEYEGGIIWQAPPAPADGDDRFQTLAFVYPGRLQSADIDGVAREFVAAIDQTLAPDGSLSTTDGTTLEGASGNDRLVGAVWTETRDTYALLWGGFGTVDSWQRTRGQVEATGRCFDLSPGKPLTVKTASANDTFGQTTFQYVVPEGWDVSAVNSVGIDIVGEYTGGVPRGHVGFGTYSGPFRWSVEQAVETWLDLMSQYGFTVQVSDSWSLGTTTDPLGYPWRTVLIEYERNATAFTESEQRYFGYQYITVLSVPGEFGTGWFTTMSWGREALTADWDRLAAVMSIIQSNIQILSRRPGQLVSPSVAQTNSEISDIIMDTWETRNAASDRMQEQFVDMIWERDRVQNPSNPGEVQLVPTASANPALCGGNERPVYNSTTQQWECWPLV